jgi:hypothetical protein
MLPVIFIQLTYKSIWMLTVWFPMSSAGLSVRFTNSMIMGLVFDLIVIPWPYVVSIFVKQRGDRWAPAPRPAISQAQS